jgi:hypothetical protein
MIDKGLYRKNFSVGGRDGPVGGNDAPGPGDTGGEGGFGKDTNQFGGKGSSPTSTGGGPERNTGLERQRQKTIARLGRIADMERFIDRPKFGFTDAASINLFSPKNIFSGIMGLINPALGLATRGLGYLGDKFQGLRGYNPDGTPRTQAEYEAAMRDKHIQSRIDNIMNRQTLGKSFSQTNLDSLLGMTDMYGNTFSPSTAQNVLTGRDLKGFTPSRMGITNIQGITNTTPGLDFINAPQNIEGYNTINAPSSNPQDYDFFSNAMAEVTQKDINASKARGFNIMDYGTAIDLGMISPNVSEYEFEQLKQGNITEPGTYIG